MKFRKDEKKLLQFLKFSPPVVTVLFATLVITFIYIVNGYTFEQDIKKLKHEFTKNNKELVRNEVTRVHEYILHQKRQTKILLEQNIKEHVNIAYSVIMQTYHEYENEDKNIIKKHIKKNLRDIRFDNGIGYFFILSHDAKMILHPIQPELEELDVSLMQDLKGQFLFQQMSALVQKHDESFFQWYWNKPHSKFKEQRKIGFLKNIPELNWYVGSGYYLDDFEKIIQKSLFEYTPTIQFGNNGYIFILDFDGTILSHYNKSLIGKNILNIQDDNGQYVVKNMINIGRNGEGFLSYNIPTEIPENHSHKTSYIKGVKDWNFLIGAGYYDNELEEKIAIKKRELNKANDEYMFNLLIISFIVTLVLTSIALYISKIVQERFIVYKCKIAQEIEKNQEKDMILAQQSKMTAMGEMIGNIAHQWRQPLSTITTASSGISLKHEFNDLTDEDFLSFTTIIEKNARYLSETIDEFKEFFNPNKVKVHFDIENTIDRTINIVSAQFTSHKITIIKNIENRSIYALENEIKQVIINILNNARDALDEYNIEKKLIFIDVYSTKNNLHIDIKDNAAGINEEIIQRVFEPYFTTKFKSKGIGIGLYMCYEIITKHLHGTIYAQNVEYTYENKSYKGAKFSIVIPLKEIENRSEKIHTV